MDGSRKRFEGYATDLATDKAIAWLKDRDKSKPFFLMCQHKAPHRTFAPALRHLGAFDDGVCHPTINVDDLDPECEMAGLVANQPRELGKVEYVLNNSFGMLGINSVCIIKKL